MAGVTWPSISFALDETIASLEQLHAQSQSNRAKAKAQLDLLVETLGVSSAPWVEESSADLVGAGRPSSPALPAPTPYVALPERTTHGGPFGPAVRAKLIAEALARR